MIQITNKADCCGCSACVNICPKQCITLHSDKEGFLYPVVDTALCIGCNLCKKICPTINQTEERTPLSTYAAMHPNEQVRLASSSGGMFSLLSEAVIDEGGVVFGARFDKDWNVIHDYTETKEGLAAFRGSKYVQSRMGNCYLKVKKYLCDGRKIMFTGTPCQIAGLNKILNKSYDNLLTVDVVCHGIPSPRVWRKYLDETALSGGENSVLPHSIHDGEALITDISFRDKRLGWKKYCFALTLSEFAADREQNTVLLSSIFTENAYMNAFLSNLSLRPSCYACPAKAGRSGSDITIADFWGIENVLPELDDDKGCSAMLIYTKKGKKLCDTLSFNHSSVSYEDIFQGNPSLETSVQKPVNRDFFFRQLFKGRNVSQAWNDCSNPAAYKRIYRFLYRNLKI